MFRNHCGFVAVGKKKKSTKNGSRTDFDPERVVTLPEPESSTEE